MMSIFELYRTKANAIYPKSEFREECLRILKEDELNDPEWIAAGEKAPTEDVLVNHLVGRTPLKNPLWKKSLARGLGYKNIKEMMGNESD